MKDCKLIATLPSLNNMDNVKKVFECPYISEVRYNTGAVSPYPPRKSLMNLSVLSEKYKKKLWIDLKGRQLRITEWGNPMFSCIKINHKITLDGPARIYLRNGEWCNIMQVVDGNKLFVDPLPKHAVGAGQSVNILSSNMTIDGYLIDKDIQFIEAAKDIGINSFMLSFVESFDDVTEVLKLIPNADLVLKIESQKGVELVQQAIPGPRYMAARDDLYIQTGLDMMNHLKTIINKDPSSICASRIFMSLEKSHVPEFCDFEDLEYMYSLGYREFMLCDNICNYALEPAIEAWKKWMGK